MKNSLKLHLASSSPRRQEILAALRLDFTAQGVDLDETPLHGETADEMVLRLAEDKALAAGMPGDVVVIGSDTEVVLDDVALGKPVDRDDAISMLLSLSGRTHQVITGVAVARGDHVAAVISSTDVQFREIGRDEADNYWQSGEPRDKAGAYGIQGLGGAFVESINGSYSCVVGLPVFETVTLLREAGIDVMARND
ncbi:MAG: Maf family protein [Pseudomonadota bacterium]